MGSTLDADVPGKRGLAHFSNASVASNGADAISGMIMIAPQSMEILAAKRTPSGDQAANANSHRKITVNNGAVVISSVAMSASVASLATQALSGTATVAAGVALNFSHATVGGAHSTGTVLQAGTLQVEYRLL